MIRLATLADVPDIVSIHLESLPGDLLPRLGRKYLSQSYYPVILNSQNAFTLVESDNGTLVGFVVYALNSEQLSQQITANRWGLAWNLLLRAPTQPQVIVDVVNFLRSKIHYPGPLTELTQAAELFSIATRPSRRNAGVGKRLVEESFKVLRGRSQKQCFVKTSSSDARRFYERIGFKTVGYETRGPKKLDILRIGL